MNKKLIAIIISQSLIFGILSNLNSAFAGENDVFLKTSYDGSCYGDEFRKLDNGQMVNIFKYINDPEKARIFSLLSRRCGMTAATSKVSPGGKEPSKRDEEIFGAKETVCIPISSIDFRRGLKSDYDGSLISGDYTDVHPRHLFQILRRISSPDTPLTLKADYVNCPGLIFIEIGTNLGLQKYCVSLEPEITPRNFAFLIQKLKSLENLKFKNINLIEYNLVLKGKVEPFALLSQFTPVRTVKNGKVKEIRYTDFEAIDGTYKVFKNRVLHMYQVLGLKRMTVKVKGPGHIFVKIEPRDESYPAEIFDFKFGSFRSISGGFCKFASTVRKMYTYFRDLNEERKGDKNYKYVILDVSFDTKFLDIFPVPGGTSYIDAHSDDPLYFMDQYIVQKGYSGKEKYIKESKNILRMKYPEEIIAFTGNDDTVGNDKIPISEKLEKGLRKFRPEHKRIGDYSEKEIRLQFLGGKNKIVTDSKTLTISGDIDYIATNAFGVCPNLEVLDLSHARIHSFHRDAINIENCPKLKKVILGAFDNVCRYVDPFCSYGKKLEICLVSLDNATYVYNLKRYVNAKSRLKVPLVFRNHKLSFDFSKVDSSAMSYYSDFSGLSNLQEVKLPKDSKYITVMSRLFLDCGLKGVLDLSDTHISVISDSAFSKNLELENVKFPNSLLYIGTYAFKKCGIKGKLDLSSTKLEKIDAGAFRLNYGIDKVVLPPSIRYVDKTAFETSVMFEYNGETLNYERLAEKLSS